MLQPGSLNNKTIIITAGGTGLGKSMGKYFLELGANLVITSRKKEVIVNTANKLMNETGGKVLAIPCDVRKYDEIENLLKEAENTFGQIHGVLNNAAGNFISPTEGAWSRLLPGELVKKFDPAERIPLKRVGDHQELANLAAYLISDYSSYINGEMITIDGGEWLRNGGEFSHLEAIPEVQWDNIEKMRGK